MQIRPRTTIAVLCALAAAIGVGACGSSSDGSSSTTASAGVAGTSSTAKGTPYKVGFICSCSGPAASSLSKSGDVIDAWAADVNANGGIDGHPVSVIVIDDANSAAKAVQGIKELLSQDVVAIIDSSLQGASWAKTIAATDVPVLGALTVDSPMFTDPNFYPSGAVLPTVLLGQVLESKAAGLTHMGVAYCAEVPVCAQLVGLVEAAAAVAGDFQITGQAVSATAPNYTAPCLKLKDAGADSLFVASPSPVVLRVAGSCAQQGFTRFRSTRRPPRSTTGSRTRT
jgi:branched-chain amino acid transport system substrate-binding protein